MGSQYPNLSPRSATAGPLKNKLLKIKYFYRFRLFPYFFYATANKIHIGDSSNRPAPIRNLSRKWFRLLGHELVR
jgi:hypothetical protein